MKWRIRRRKERSGEMRRMHRRREKNEEPMMGTEEADKREGVRSNEGGREGEMEGGE